MYLFLDQEYSGDLEPDLNLWMEQNLEASFNHYTLSHNWFKIIWTKIVRYYQRFKACLKLLFTGYLLIEGCFILQGENHIQDIIDAFSEGKDQLIKAKDKWMDNNFRQEMK